MIEQRNWYAIEAAEVLRTLESTRSPGLTDEEAARRLGEYGSNELHKVKKVSPIFLLLAQFKNILVCILLIAVGISAFVGHSIEAITIAIIVVFAVLLGFVQEYKAEKAIEALEKMAAPLANVLRGGVTRHIPSSSLVPGDIVFLGAGDLVPADGRILESINLKTQEASLTGESLPVEKISEAIPGTLPSPGDRRNIVFAGTAVTYGRGVVVVTATGMHTEFGNIATMLESVRQEPTPLQKNLDTVGKTLAKGAFGIVLFISAIGIYRGESFISILLFGIALAVAVVPEALPAVVTTSLAIGVQRMSKRNALIRRLPAVETLGGVTIICTDKTGTLTRDEMTVRSVYTAGTTYHVSGTGYSPEGAFTIDDHAVEPSPALMEALTAGVLSSDATLQNGDAWSIKGDSTEGAIVVAAAKAGIHKENLDARFPRVAEVPFTSETKRMTTLHQNEEVQMSYSKGAPEMLLPLCTRIWGEHGEQPMTEQNRQAILQHATDMAKKGLRVLAVTRKGTDTIQNAHNDMKFLGLFGMIDPPREEAKKSIQTCMQSGIRVMMITGDHPVTAAAIAMELGISTSETAVCSGLQLESMTDPELSSIVSEMSVFARVSPSHKLRIVTALQEQGHIAAMTGDGVNDAPALKKANIGVAMGITGTDVSKEAAAMTLTDDNFASIVAAVEEGRAIYGNIKKYLMYLLSSNVGEITLMTVATVVGWPLPLSAVQILYVNLATDGLPALALALDPPSKNLMNQPPRDPRKGIFTKNVVSLILLGGIWSAILTLSLFWYSLSFGKTHTESMTIVFVTLVLIEFFKAYSLRAPDESILSGMLKNKWLNAAIVWQILLLVVTVYWAPFQQAFGTHSLTLSDWILLLPIAFSVVPVLEIGKIVIRRWK